MLLKYNLHLFFLGDSSTGVDSNFDYFCSDLVFFTLCFASI